MTGFPSRSLLALAVAVPVILSPVCGSNGLAMSAYQPPPPPAAPVPAAPSPTVPTPFEATHSLLFDHLANALSNNPSLDQAGLAKVGLDQFTKILQVIKNDPNATPSVLDTKLITDLAGSVFNFIKKTNPSPVGGGTAPANTAANTNTTTPTTTTTPAPATSTVPASITGGVRDRLKARLVEADSNSVKVVVNDGRPTPSLADRQASLKRFVQANPTGRPGGGTFLDLFNAQTGQEVTSDHQLSADDAKTIDAMINEVVGLPPAANATPATPAVAGPASTPAANTPDLGVGVAETAVTVLGDIFPQFAPFETLADEAIQYVVPAIERWRPFRRWRRNRGAVLLDGGGTVTTSGSRAVYIYP